jgi:hypothetical protein
MNTRVHPVLLAMLVAVTITQVLHAQTLAEAAEKAAANKAAAVAAGRPVFSWAGGKDDCRSFNQPKLIDPALARPQRSVRRSDAEP